MDSGASCLTRLDALIEREILRLRARYELSLDEFRGLYVSDEQVDRLVARGRTAPGPAPTAEIAPLAAGLRDEDDRWRRVAETFGLSPLEQDLLLIGAAPELDPKYETLYAYLNNDVTRKWPTADLARRLLADVSDAGAVLRALAPGATLRARHLVDPVGPPSGRPSMLNAGYFLDPCLTYWIRGHSPSLAFDTAGVVWSSGEALGIEAPAHARAVPILRLLNGARQRTGASPLIALVGPPGSGRAATAAAVAAALERPLARVDLRALADAEAEEAEVLESLELALCLEPAVVLLEGVDGPADEDSRRERHVMRLVRALSAWPSSAVVLASTSGDAPGRAFAGARRVIEVPCELGTFPARLATWRAAANAEAVRLSDGELGGFAGRFRLTSRQIRETLATARDLAAMAGMAEGATPEHVAAAARLGSDQALGRLAVKVDRKHDWSDLVLPASTLRRLRELAAAIRQRHVVYDEWGFGERVSAATGIKALFAGGSGTGKTMAAGVIARELGLDLYKVDLSGVVSKYIGETEKNLDRIFRAARSANAIVFLDEAEAIMGKRSEVKDAHDRYANIEVAYLLQRLEDHDGTVILATNLKRNIDDAFARRMQYVVDFPRPGESERERIWRLMFPPWSPLARDVDFAFLAKHFDLAGGDIRNVVLDAAFLAAEDGGAIDMRTIVEALARQLAKEGKTPTGTEFRQYQRLLDVAPVERRAP